MPSISRVLPPRTLADWSLSDDASSRATDSCFAAIIPIAFNVEAALIAYDGFEEYAPGAVHLLNGGTGWRGPYVVNYGLSQVNVSAGGLDYTNGEVNLAGGSRSMQLSGPLSLGQQPLFYRRFPTGSPRASDIYFSFLFRTSQDSPTEDQDLFQLGLHSTPSGISPSGSPAAGMGIDSGLGPFPAALRFSARLTEPGFGTPTSSFIADPGRAEETYFLVGKVSANSPSRTAFDRIDLFLNPATLAEPVNPDATVRQGAVLGSLGYFLGRVGGIDANDTYTIDELRIGTSYTSVVPEPTGLSILLAGAVHFVFMRRSRRSR